MRYREVDSRWSEGDSVLPPPVPPPPPPGSRRGEGIKEEEKWKPSKGIFIVFGTMCLVSLATSLDATSISVALPTIAAKLNGTSSEASWAGISYLMASAVFQPTISALSDIFGRRPLILSSLILFTSGAAIAGTAGRFEVILLGRTIQGIGGGGLYTLNQILTTDLIPLRERGKFLGFISTMWSIGSVSGPLVGGVLVQKLSWRCIFFVNVPFCTSAFIGVILFLKLRRKTGPLVEMLKKVDWFGILIFMGAIPALLIPITWGGVMYPWNHPSTIVPIVVGVLGVAAFICYEKCVPPNPMVRLVVFTNRTSVVNYIGTMLHGMILWIMFYYLPLYFLAIKDLSPIMTGVSMFPLTITLAPTSVLAGIFISDFGHYRAVIWAGWSLTAFGVGILTLLDVQTFTVQWVYMMVPSGVGVGILFPSMNYAIQAAASNENSAFAVGMFSFCRALGQCFGVAIGSVVFQNALKSHVGRVPEMAHRAAEYAANAVGLVEVIQDMPLSTPGRAGLLEAYALALRDVWRVTLILAAVGLAASLATRELSLDRKLETDQGFIGGEKPQERGEEAPLESSTSRGAAEGLEPGWVKHGFIFTDPGADFGHRNSLESGGPYAYADPGPYTDREQQIGPRVFLYEDDEAFIPALGAGRYRHIDEGFQDPSAPSYADEFDVEAYIDSFIGEQPHAYSIDIAAYL